MNQPSNSSGGVQHNQLRRQASRLFCACFLFYIGFLLLLSLFENRLIFPAPRYPSGDWEPAWLVHEDVEFASPDGTKLHGWYLDHPAPRTYLLYCHGNGEHVAYAAPVADELRSTLDAAVFVFDYRGYGRSQGSAEEKGVLQDGRAAHKWLSERAGVPPDQIVVMGRSLGGAVAVDLANQFHTRKLVLESTFPSIPEVAARLHWWAPVKILIRTQLNSVDKISRYEGGLLQSHGSADTMIPLELGRRLFDAAPTSDKEFIVFDALGHNDYPPQDYYVRLRRFVQRDSTSAR